ncbi:MULTISPECIES: TIGR03790 family protein [Methylotenera]|uniref:TIGR03790 family protein n=1 Tax=Methylotenera TaxID=359407 RepID=UPI0003658257|nr:MULTISPECIES: TIGR03790 family protein [Methylotenera]
MLIKKQIKRLFYLVANKFGALSEIRFLVILGLLFSVNVSAGEPSTSTSTFTANNVAVIVNVNDANSIAIGDYYINARNIPKKNLITVDIPTGVAALSEVQFKSLREKIFSNIGDDIEVIVLAWTRPYAVNCNAITAAITLGYQAKQCEDSCAVGIDNPYFNSHTHNPKKDFNMRLSILLPTDSIEVAKNMIDKGVLSSFKLNESTAYFLKTKDEARSKPREAFFPKDLTKVESKKLWIRTISADSIRDKKDVMFYFTGAVSVPYLETLNFMPGAVADHLTSGGGVLVDGGQMSSLKWLEAGATGTFGSVSEPCNYWQKFPNPAVLLTHYLAGETLIESYWKSIYWPTQGLILGEPLAAPYSAITSGF